MTTAEERISHIEGILPSLATKEDLAHLESRLIKWMAVSQFLGITAIAAAVGAVAAIMKFLA